MSDKIRVHDDMLDLKAKLPDHDDVAVMLDEEPVVPALITEIRRLQKALIDADVLTHCEDLCMVVCAGPCMGEGSCGD